MSPLALPALAPTYARIKAELLATFPELAEDEAALLDTLDGESDLADVVASLVRAAREDEALAKALKGMEDDMSARRARFIHRAEMRERAALSLMLQAERKKVKTPDLTITTRSVPPRVDVYDLDAVPAAYVKVTKIPDKVSLKEALAAGEVPGVRWSNGGVTLAVKAR